MSGVPGTYRNGHEKLDPRNFPPGTVGVIGAEVARFHNFTHSLMGVTTQLPPGSGMSIQCSADVCGNLNSIIRGFRGDWLWIMGDDHVFDHDIVLRLLAHNVDVIVPHCLKRQPGWDTVVYSHQDEDGYYNAAELPERGLTKVHAAGSAGMLVKREVLEAVGDPWFTPGPLGLAEDVEFCRKVRDAGFSIYCDPEVLLGHTSLHTVWPDYRNGRWHIRLNHDQKMDIPMDRLADQRTPLEPVEAVAA